MVWIFKVAKTVDLIKAKGGKVTREPGPVKGGKTVIAFIEDPDGYKFELLERGLTPEPLCQVMLRVGDLDRSIEFYEKVRFLVTFYMFTNSWYMFFLCSLSLCVSNNLQAYGMELLRKRDNPEYKVKMLSNLNLANVVLCVWSFNIFCFLLPNGGIRDAWNKREPDNSYMLN